MNIKTVTKTVSRETALAKAKALLVRRGIGDPSGKFAESLADEAMAVQRRARIATTPSERSIPRETRGMASATGGTPRIVVREKGTISVTVTERVRVQIAGSIDLGGFLVDIPVSDDDFNTTDTVGVSIDILEG